MNKALTSLAILKVNYDSAGKNYLQSFIPFIATLISQKKIKDLADINSICRDFKREWNLEIPYHPMISILNFAKKAGIFKSDERGFVPNEENIKNADFTDKALEMERKANKVVKEFIIYCKNRFNYSLSQDNAESALIAYLHNHDLDILFASEKETILPYVKKSAKHIYLIGNFIKESYKSEPEIFSFLVDIAVGHILASALIYDKIDEIGGNLKGLTLYLDTGLIFRIMDYNEKEWRDINISLLDMLRRKGAILRLFRTNYDEIIFLLEAARIWVDNPFYDPTKASLLIKKLRWLRYKPSDVDRLILNLNPTLEKNGIKIVDLPNPNEFKQYQIDPRELEEIIIELYREVDIKFDKIEKEQTIQRDIDAIAAVFKQRKGHKPITLTRARYIFITSNCTLAYASTCFERKGGTYPFRIPSCITDVFLGTCVWLQSPNILAEINSKKLIADCYAAIAPNDRLLRLYIAEINRLKQTGTFSDDDCQLLRTHEVAYDILQEKTLGDTDSFTKKTTEEIYEELKERIRKEEEKKYKDEVLKHDQTKRELRNIKLEKYDLVVNINDRAEQYSNKVAKYLFAASAIFLMIGLSIMVTPNTFTFLGIFKYPLFVVSFVATLASLLYGFNLKGLRSRFKAWLKSRFIKRIMKKSAS